METRSKIIKERIKEELTELEIKMLKREIEKETKMLKEYERMVRFKIEKIKELEIELKELKLEVESEQF